MEALNPLTLRLVLDTNQIVGAGSRWLVSGTGHASSNRHLRLLRLTATAHTGLYCDAIIEEYLGKLLQRGHPPDRARRLVAYIRGAFECVQLVSAQAPVRPRDPDDEVFLLCAVDGDADYLVSEDRDLVELADHYASPVIARCDAVLSDLESRPHSNSPSNGGNTESSGVQYVVWGTLHPNAPTGDLRIGRGPGLGPVQRTKREGLLAPAQRSHLLPESEESGTPLVQVAPADIQVKVQGAVLVGSLVR